MKSFAAAILTVSLLSACSSPGVSRDDENIIIKAMYAQVQSVEPITLSSEVNTNAAAGAVVGVLDNADGNREEMIGGAVVGALIGGLFTKLAEGSNEAYQYNLYSEQEGHFSIVQKELINTQSECVHVRIAGEVSVQPAPESYCYSDDM